MNNFEKYLRHLVDQGESLTQNRVEVSCGCSLDVVVPPQPQAISNSFGYVVNPCAKHPRGWDELA